MNPDFQALGFAIVSTAIGTKRTSAVTERANQNSSNLSDVFDSTPIL